MPAGSGSDDVEREPVFNEFDSDTHRRVAANLSVPRSARGLAAYLSRHDPHVESEAYGEGSVQDYLDDLEAEGLVAKIGSFEDAKAAVATVRDDDDLIDFPKAKADAFAERAERDDVDPFLDEVHYVMTAAGLERLTAPVPNEPPPLTGPALKAAEKANRQLAEHDRERAREMMLDAARKLRERADEIEEEAEEL